MKQWSNSANSLPKPASMSVDSVGVQHTFKWRRFKAIVQGLNFDVIFCTCVKTWPPPTAQRAVPTYSVPCTCLWIGLLCAVNEYCTFVFGFWVLCALLQSMIDLEGLYVNIVPSRLRSTCTFPSAWRTRGFEVIYKERLEGGVWAYIAIMMYKIRLYDHFT